MLEIFPPILNIVSLILFCDFSVRNLWKFFCAINESSLYTDLPNKGNLTYGERLKLDVKKPITLEDLTNPDKK